MRFDAEEALVRGLRGHNPWWERGVEAFSLPDRPKRDFYRLARPDRSESRFEDQSVLALVGRRGVGKTTLLHQFVASRVEAGDAPGRFCYLPLDADPLYQLRVDEQLARAVRYYERRVLSRVDDDPHFLLVDDVHRAGHGEGEWGDAVAAVAADHPGRHVAVTATAARQVERALDDTALDGYDTQPVLPETFRDYLYALAPDLGSSAHRVGPTPLRSGDGRLPAALERGDPERFVAELRARYDRVADVERRIRPQVPDYLATGGTVGYDRDGAVADASDLSPAAYDRLRADVRDALYRELPGVESVRTVANLERLCALAARTRAREPLRFQELTDLFEVDRRTLVDSYLSALSAVSLLDGVTEYDNGRPRSVRLYLRDTGLVTAFGGADPGAVGGDHELEADLARVAGYDHTVRFARGVEAARGREAAPTVQFWQGRRGEVDYVFEVDGRPVPVGLAYRARDHEDAAAAVRAFLDEFGTPVGLLLTGDTAGGAGGVERLGDGVVGVPYWLYLLCC
jgi:hypothetical protein